MTQSIKLILKYLKSNGLHHEYRSDTEVISFYYCGIRMNFFIVDDALWCLSHSEHVRSIDAGVRLAIVDSLEGGTYTRPVPNVTTNTTKFKTVTYMPDPSIYENELLPELIRDLAGCVLLFRQKYIYYRHMMMDEVFPIFC